MRRLENRPSTFHVEGVQFRPFHGERIVTTLFPGVAGFFFRSNDDGKRNGKQSGKQDGKRNGKQSVFRFASGGYSRRAIKPVETARKTPLERLETRRVCRSRAFHNTPLEAQ